MKTIVVWEHGDIQVGRWFYKHGNGDIVPANYGHFVSTAHMIGYCGRGSELVTISLADGSVSPIMSQEEMIDLLNRNSYIPLLSDLLLELIKFQAE